MGNSSIRNYGIYLYGQGGDIGNGITTNIAQIVQHNPVLIRILGSGNFRHCEGIGSCTTINTCIRQIYPYGAIKDLPLICINPGRRDAQHCIATWANRCIYWLR